jgi:hypothetical protein
MTALKTPSNEAQKLAMTCGIDPSAFQLGVEKLAGSVVHVHISAYVAHLILFLHQISVFYMGAHHGQACKATSLMVLL